MAKAGGGNSHQRRTNERLDQAVTDALLRMGKHSTGPAEDAADPQMHRKEASHKWTELWRSTPIWGAVGVLAGTLLAQVSVILVFIAVWLVICVEFVSLRLIPNKPVRYLCNFAFGAVLAMAFWGLWRVAPRPTTPPTLDQQMDAFAKRFPELLHGDDHSFVKASAAKTEAPARPQESKPRIQWRLLRPAEIQRFERVLRGQAAPKQTIRLACAAADETACVYAGQFINVFKEAGFTVDTGMVQRVTLGIPYEGIRLFGHTDKGFDPNDPPNTGRWLQITPTLVSIYKAFSTIGVEADGGTDAGLPEQMLTIYVGPARVDEGTPTQFSATIKMADAQYKKSPPKINSPAN
jgi:hypothetical protein